MKYIYIIITILLMAVFAFFLRSEVKKQASQMSSMESYIEHYARDIHYDKYFDVGSIEHRIELHKMYPDVYGLNADLYDSLSTLATHMNTLYKDTASDKYKTYYQWIDGFTSNYHTISSEDAYLSDGEAEEHEYRIEILKHAQNMYTEWENQGVFDYQYLDSTFNYNAREINYRYKCFNRPKNVHVCLGDTFEADLYAKYRYYDGNRFTNEWKTDKGYIKRIYGDGYCKLYIPTTDLAKEDSTVVHYRLEAYSTVPHKGTLYRYAIEDSFFISY